MEIGGGERVSRRITPGLRQAQGPPLCFNETGCHLSFQEAQESKVTIWVRSMQTQSTAETSLSIYSKDQLFCNYGNPSARHFK